IGNSLDYGFRHFDSRLAKFLSLDPLSKKFPWYSPYHFAGNTPIQAIDLEGLEILKINSSMYRMKYLGELFVGTVESRSLEPVNQVNIIEENVPSNYPLSASYNVGAHGYNNPVA